MKAVADSSVLIFFAKIRRLDILKKLFGELYASGTVASEILRGRGEGYSGADEFEAFSQSGQLSLVGGATLASGEDATIALAKKINAGVVLMDDYAGNKKARLAGLRVRSCPFLLLFALKKGLISKMEFDRLLDLLLSFNYFISPRMLKKVIEAGEKLGSGKAEKSAADMLSEVDGEFDPDK